MVSLWGSKNGEEEEHENGDTQQESEGSRPNTRQPDRRDPDERSRLLPPRRDGYLDPDDPAVSCAPPFHCYQVLMLGQIGLAI